MSARALSPMLSSRRFPEPTIPCAVTRGSTALKIAGRPVPADEFRDPFFSDTLMRLTGQQSKTTFVPRSCLAERARLDPFAEPAGFIVHVSRCGSTLLANLLREIPACLALSEPTAINDLLMPPYDNWTDHELVGGLRHLAGAFHTAGGGRPYILKLRSWNSLRIDLLRRAFPATPWAFVVRCPLEVAISVLARPPTWLRCYGDSANPFLSWLRPNARIDTVEDYLSEVLASFADAVAMSDRSQAILIPYETFGPTTWSALASHFGFEVDALVLRRMAAQAALYSKDVTRQRRFVDDTAQKRVGASKSLRGAIERRAMQAFDQLRRDWSLT